MGPQWDLLIGEESLKGIIKEIETTELAQQDHEHEIVLHDDIKILLSQAANFIERQEEELRWPWTARGKSVAAKLRALRQNLW